ncbi:Hypothetical protein LUCI_2271 [Lucifera butyrica]|uniref:Polymerase/histidinol phosphatase N-terminal domain-containing protein n=1 Tax=Lucifera butyrica TaxID=1351585 RepID=A0A498R7Z5_9FIRM|nr:PHP domain-containing protein [Lucifera butyrica]VBB07027.1 Hypothetical protein LUCI_2271 [Lucifera butyrica]
MKPIHALSMRADLHIHTTASDGCWSPRQLIDELTRREIGLFAVTDHDSVDNVVDTAVLAQKAGLHFLTGVEISATHKGGSFHILGYGIDPACEALRRLLIHNQTLMEEADHESIRKLIADGLPVDFAEYHAYRHDPARGGWKSLNFLIDKGLCSDVKDFFARWFTPERGISFPEFPSLQAVGDAITAAGGVPVLAHPGSEFHGCSLEETLQEFAGGVIEGVECYHPGHDAATTRQALAWCLQHNLIVTGGSDCHGDFVSGRQLGFPAIEGRQLLLGRLWDRVDTCL